MDEEYQGPGAGRYVRRRNTNQALWIALGAAVLVGLVFLFVVMGSSGGEGYKLEGKQAFEEFLTSLFKDEYRGSLGRIHLEGMLVEYNPGALKSRAQWTPEKRKELEVDLYRNLRLRLQNELRLTSVSDIRQKVIDRAEVTWDSYHDEVRIRWMTDPYDKVIAERRLHVAAEPWIATVVEVNDRWLVARFGAEK